jgi:hypothetical protein
MLPVLSLSRVIPIFYSTFVAIGYAVYLVSIVYSILFIRVIYYLVSSLACLTLSRYGMIVVNDGGDTYQIIDVSSGELLKRFVIMLVGLC